MAETTNNGPSIAALVLYGILILFVIWLVTGGPARVENKYNPYLRQPAPIEDFSVYGEGGSLQTNVEDVLTEGTYQGWSLHSKKSFSFLTPPNWSTSSSGSFSETEFGEISNDEIQLQYQYGPDANPLDFENDLSYEIVYGKVNGRWARFVRPHDSFGQTTGAFIKRNKKKRITVFTNEELTQEQEQEVFEIINTIRI